MAPGTRSQACKFVDDNQTAPYTSSALVHMKKFGKAEGLVGLFDCPKTPETIEIEEELPKVLNSVSEKLSEDSGLHLMGNILYNASKWSESIGSVRT